MKEIGIIVAMDEERETILDIMTDVKIEQMYNLRFIKGKIHGKECILVKSGVGKVNAARTAQIMIDKYDLQYVINIGVGGAINPFLNIGDVLIGKNVVQHDFDITAFGHSKGYITGVGDKIECDLEFINKIEHIIQTMPERNYKIKR